MSTSSYCLITALLGAGIGIAHVRARARRRSDVTGVPTVEGDDLLRTIWIGAGWFALQCTVGVVLFDFEFWDLLSVVFHDVAIGLPLVGAAVLGSRMLHPVHPSLPTATRPAVALAILALVPGAIGFYAARVEPYRVRVDRATTSVPGERTGDDPLVIGVIADLQTVAVTQHERDAVERVMAASPDVIVVAGDVFQGSAEQLDANRPALRELFASLDAPGGVYLVPGDVDAVPELESFTEGTDVTVLTDESVRIGVRDRSLVVGGMSLEVTRDGLTLLRGLQNAPGSEIRVLVAHRPDWALRLDPDSRVDLVVAGHTHGGQVQLPGIGPLLTLSDVPRDVAAGGLHEIEGNAVYVSTGVGREQQGAPQVRFLAPPSVAIITLEG